MPHFGKSKKRGIDELASNGSTLSIADSSRNEIDDNEVDSWKLPRRAQQAASTVVKVGNEMSALIEQAKAVVGTENTDSASEIKQGTVVQCLDSINTGVTEATNVMTEIKESLEQSKQYVHQSIVGSSSQLENIGVYGYVILVIAVLFLLCHICHTMTDWHIGYTGIGIITNTLISICCLCCAMAATIVSVLFIVYITQAMRERCMPGWRSGKSSRRETGLATGLARRRSTVRMGVRAARNRRSRSMNAASDLFQ